MPRILLTGFEPFGRYNLNSSWELVTALPDTIGNFECIKLCLPVEFNAVSDLIPKLLSEHHPDIILSFGQSTSDAIRIERVAINIDDARTPDNSGYIPTDMPIHADGENAYFTSIPLAKASEKVSRMGIPCKISNTAGLYVCNAAFYTALHYAHMQGRGLRVGFVHLPSMGVEQGQMVESVKMIIQTIVEDEQIR